MLMSPAAGALTGIVQIKGLELAAGDNGSSWLELSDSVLFTLWRGLVCGM